MQENLDMNSYKIIDVAKPTHQTDAATKKYVDDADSATLTAANNHAQGIFNVKVNVDGTSTMTGNLKMGNYKISRMTTPTHQTDAATKKYVDYKVSASSSSGGGGGSSSSTVGTTNLNMNTHKILNLSAPVQNADAANKKYVDDADATTLTAANNHAQGIFNVKVNVDRTSTMTGNLKMGNHKISGMATPTQNADAATKKYVDDQISASSSGGGSGSSVGNSDLDMNNHRITNLGTPTGQTDAVTKEYVDNESTELRNGTVPMTGSLNMGNNKIENLAKPTQNADAGRKKYVDDGVQSKLSTVYGGTMSAEIDMNNHKILKLATPTANTDAVTKKNSDDGDYTLLQDIQKRLRKDIGGFMNGAINMNNNRILGLPTTPVTDTDAVTKKYVDDENTKQNTKMLFYLDKRKGGLIQGPLWMSNMKIADLGDPDNEGDAATKKYVDEKSFGVKKKCRHRRQNTVPRPIFKRKCTSGTYVPSNKGWGTDFRWNPYTWSKVPLMGNQKSVHFSDSPLNNMHKLTVNVAMPNKYWTAGKNFGMVFATKFVGNNTISSTTLDVIDQSSNAETMDIKKLRDVTVNGQTYVTHMKIQFLFTGSGNTQGYVYNRFVFDGYTKTRYDNANLTTNPDFLHFPGFDHHKFVDSTTGDILLAGVHDSASDTVTVKKLRIEKENLSSELTKTLEKSKQKHISTVLKFGSMTKRTKLYSGIAFPVSSGTSKIRMELLTHKFSGNSSIPNDLVLEFGMKFFIKNAQPTVKALTHLRYTNYEKDQTGMVILDQKTFTQPPSNCIGTDIYIKQTNQVENLGRKSDILVNYVTE